MDYKIMGIINGMFDDNISIVKLIVSFIMIYLSTNPHYISALIERGKALFHNKYSIRLEWDDLMGGSNTSVGEYVVAYIMKENGSRISSFTAHALFKDVAVLDDTFKSKESKKLYVNQHMIKPYNMSMPDGNVYIAYTVGKEKYSNKNDNTLLYNTYTLVLTSNDKAELNAYFTKACVEGKAIMDAYRLALSSNVVYPKIDEENKKERLSLLFSSEKTFENIFFDDKDKLKKHFSDFVQRKIDKMILLLEGPPGTGKTSIIKSIINEINTAGEKRDGQSVDLGKVKTYEDLMKIIYHKREQKVSFIEDITDQDIPSIIKKEYLKKAPVFPMFQEKEDEKESKDKIDVDDTKKSLTYSELLNVLDGVCEFTRGILIITTNNVEKIKESFIRPGRVTLRLHLNSLNDKSLNEMLNYYKNKKNIQCDLSSIKYHGNLTASEVEEIITNEKDIAQSISVMSCAKASK